MLFRSAAHAVPASWRDAKLGVMPAAPPAGGVCRLDVVPDAEVRFGFPAIADTVHPDTVNAGPVSLEPSRG